MGKRMQSYVGRDSEAYAAASSASARSLTDGLVRPALT